MHFWNDTGRHFQREELAHYLLNIVPVEYNIHVTRNFFGKHHGKSTVDGNFGFLSRILKDIENWNQVKTIDDLIFFNKTKRKTDKKPTGRWPGNVAF